MYGPGALCPRAIKNEEPFVKPHKPAREFL